LGVSSQTHKEIRKIAASFLLAMTTVFMVTLSVTDLGHKNSCHREERSDLLIKGCRCDLLFEGVHYEADNSRLSSCPLSFEWPQKGAKDAKLHWGDG
jgi:hypothetical protein